MATGMQAITPDAIGARVSVRHLVDAPGGDHVPTDVVGRLLAVDDTAVLVVDRAGTLHVVAPDRVVASRIVPKHPRLPPEPDVGHEDAPLYRQAARIVVLDVDGRILLVGHHPGDGRRVWTAPGGGLLPGEDHVDAARRELHEELGLVLTPGPVVWTRRVTFAFRGVWIDQDERWLLHDPRVDGFDPAGAPLDDAGTSEARWWSVADLETTDEELAPASLSGHLARLLVEGPPDPPVDVGR